MKEYPGKDEGSWRCSQSRACSFSVVKEGSGTGLARVLTVSPGVQTSTCDKTVQATSRSGHRSLCPRYGA